MCQGVNIRTVYQALTILVIVRSGRSVDLALIIGLDPSQLGWWEAVDTGVK